MVTKPYPINNIVTCSYIKFWPWCWSTFKRASTSGCDMGCSDAWMRLWVGPQRTWNCRSDGTLQVEDEFPLVASNCWSLFSWTLLALRVVSLLWHARMGIKNAFHRSRNLVELSICCLFQHLICGTPIWSAAKLKADWRKFARFHSLKFPMETSLPAIYPLKSTAD